MEHTCTCHQGFVSILRDAKVGHAQIGCHGHNVSYNEDRCAIPFGS